MEYQDKIHLTLLVHFEAGMNRRMTCTVGEDETSIDLADELVYYGLICEVNIWLFYEPLTSGGLYKVIHLKKPVAKSFRFV